MSLNIPFQRFPDSFKIEKSKYLFVDGENLRSIDKRYSALINNGNPISTNACGFHHIDIQKICHGYKRIFFYDALPKDNEEKTKKRQIEFENLGSIKNLHVRSGTAKYNRKIGLKQKGVDILLAIEAYQNAISGNMDVAEIITSDLDFYPLFSALLQTRVLTHLIHDSKNISKDLINCADEATPIDVTKYLSWMNDEFDKNYNIENGNQKFDNDNYELEEDVSKDSDHPLKLYRSLSDDMFIGYSEVLTKSVKSNNKGLVLILLDEWSGYSPK